jgi:isocitrate dehydrogenase kinase/phosphatase
MPLSDKSVGSVGSEGSAGAEILADGYVAYRDAFARITAQAARRFAHREWAAMQADARERLDLYGSILRATVVELRAALGERVRERAVWSAMKESYVARIAGRGDVELAETFFNSASRRVFVTVGVDPTIEFVAPEPAHLLRTPGASTFRSYDRRGSTADVLRRVLEERAVEAPWEDLERDLRLAAAEVEARLDGPLSDDRVDAVQVVVPIFFRNKAAYVVGRILRGAEVIPLVFALTYPSGGVVIDAVLTETDEVSQVFSFTRSYFHVDLPQPYETVRFLKSILPAKPIAELYIAIGHHKHGKTELYRDLLRHLAESDEPFVVAPGEEGLVMLVFTLPSYDVVFKIIRDTFGPSKSVTREQVHDRYRLVYLHDRAGRLIDAQEYEHLEFDRARFAERLLAKLLAGAAETVSLVDGRVSIRHLWTERRIEPLNLYLARASREPAEAAVLEFGQAIKDLAVSNVFPGDLLPKNFGVTRHGRVVFYDYDELCPLVGLRFRELPAVAEEPEEGPDSTFYVGPNDIFPEEFERFLGLRGALRDRFLDAHADLLTPRYWRELQERIRGGEFPDFFPYSSRLRLPLRRATAGA